MKTPFLVFLAPGAHRSEVLALTRPVEFQFPEGKRVAVLTPDPQFVPKTRRGLSSIKPFTLQALPSDGQQGDIALVQ
jgi:hypothetical protein